MYDVVYRLNRYIVNPLVLLLFAVTALYFIYGVFRMYIAEGSEEERRTGSRHVLAGLLGMVIILSVFTIMQFIVNTLNATLDSNITTPQTVR